MPFVIRRIEADKSENHIELAGDEWRLREQIEVLEAWLAQHHAELQPCSSWIADVGFCLRSDAAGGGPRITRRLMELCLETNLEIYFSEYPGAA